MPVAEEALPSADPGEVVDTFLNLFKEPNAWTKILSAVLLLAACLVVMKIVSAVTGRALDRLSIEKGLHTFVRSVVRILMWFVTLAVVLGFIGVDPTSLIAIFSVAGLAVSLAIQGTLSNLAGGITILTTKPFKSGDFIETTDYSGTVSEIGMVYTKLKTYDNKQVVVPNGQLSNARITNYSSAETRRVDLKFNLSYDASVDKIKKAVLEVVGIHPKALFTPAPFVQATAYLDSSIEYSVRVWCATEDYWDLYNSLMEQIKTAFDQAGIEMTYNHLNVHIREG